MTKEELIDFLKDNLSVTVDSESDYDYETGKFGNPTITVSLVLDKEIISSEYATIDT